MSIATHNIRGVTKTTNQLDIISEMLERKIDIMGLSETKLTQDNQNWAFNQQDEYQCYTSSNQYKPYGSGVALLIKKPLSKHVHSIQKIEGHVIIANLLFKKHKLSIIQVYLPNDKRESSRFQQLIRNQILSKQQSNFEIIVMRTSMQ